jgi:hypothetical protein
MEVTNCRYHGEIATMTLDAATSGAIISWTTVAARKSMINILDQLAFSNSAIKYIIR